LSTRNRPQHNSINNSVKYICFSDKKFKCRPWEIRIVKFQSPNHRKNARKLKTQSHIHLKEFEYSVWIDGRFRIMNDFTPYIERWLGKNDIAVIEHPKRDCIYEEATVCIKKKRIMPKLLKNRLKDTKMKNILHITD